MVIEKNNGLGIECGALLSAQTGGGRSTRTTARKIDTRVQCGQKGLVMNSLAIWTMYSGMIDGASAAAPAPAAPAAMQCNAKSTRDQAAPANTTHHSPQSCAKAEGMFRPVACGLSISLFRFPFHQWRRFGCARVADGSNKAVNVHGCFGVSADLDQWIRVLAMVISYVYIDP